MPFTRRRQRHSILQTLAIYISRFSANDFQPLSQQLRQVSELISTQRTREEWSPSRIRALLSLLRNLLTIIDKSISSLQRLSNRVHTTVVLLETFDENHRSICIHLKNDHNVETGSKESNCCEKVVRL